MHLRHSLFILVATLSSFSQAHSEVLDDSDLREYVDRFNHHDHTHFGQAISNEKAADWMAANVPRFECPDQAIEEIYHFRWWTFRKHLKQTPDGYVITEFLPQVSWSAKYNTISCAAGHHFREGRWIHQPEYLNDYAKFWFRHGGAPRHYSFWAADSILQLALTRGDFSLATELLPDLIANHRAWEERNQAADGLFWQSDDRDGMEMSISGTNQHRGQAKRPTINSYMYGDARAIAEIARRAGQPETAKKFDAKAEHLQQRVMKKLWNEESNFFKSIPREDAKPLTDVRELSGYTPWYFNLPEPNKGYEIAWRQLTDPEGFQAPYGPTTAERRHQDFTLSYEGHECQWNGPSWPYATTVTLVSLANVLHDYPQKHISRSDYFELLKTYTKSHRLTLPSGESVPWIDENLNPLTGDWISRTRLKTWKNGTWDPGKGGIERGKDYNHSAYCDLIITGLVGLRPQAGNTLTVSPLLPPDTWDYFCLDHIRYHGHLLTILYDKTGDKYSHGPGLHILANGKKLASAPSLESITTTLPEK